MENYVLGFLFNKDLSQVVLILKNRPLWCKGLYNGLGGSIEEGETAEEAMRREFKEEAGALIEKWDFVFEIYRDDDFSCYVFRSILDVNDLNAIVRTAEDQPVVVCDPKNLPYNVVPNLHWQIPLILDFNSVPYNIEGVIGIK